MLGPCCLRRVCAWGSPVTAQHWLVTEQGRGSLCFHSCCECSQAKMFYVVLILRVINVVLWECKHRKGTGQKKNPKNSGWCGAVRTFLFLTGYGIRGKKLCIKSRVSRGQGAAGKLSRLLAGLGSPRHAAAQQQVPAVVCAHNRGCRGWGGSVGLAVACGGPGSVRHRRGADQRLGALGCSSEQWQEGPGAPSTAQHQPPTRFGTPQKSTQHCNSCQPGSPLMSALCMHGTQGAGCPMQPLRLGCAGGEVGSRLPGCRQSQEAVSGQAFQGRA